MPYLKVRQDSSIENIEFEQFNGAIEVSVEDILEVSLSKFGHESFDFISGAIVKNQSREDSFQLDVDKVNYANDLIKKEVVNIAKERLATVLTTVKGVNSMAELNSLKGTS